MLADQLLGSYSCGALGHISSYLGCLNVGAPPMQEGGPCLRVYRQVILGGHHRAAMWLGWLCQEHGSFDSTDLDHGLGFPAVLPCFMIQILACAS